MEKQQIVIETAKKFAKSGECFRFFSIAGEIWECYQSSYEPHEGERLWVAAPVPVFHIHARGEK